MSVKSAMPKYTTMPNKVMLSTESRMRGDMQVRFGGRYGKTYCRKAVRRPVPSLRLGEGGTLLTLVMRLERCDSREAVRRLQNGEKGDTGIASISPGIGEPLGVGGALSVVRPATVPALRILSDASLRHPALVGYLASRGIVPPVVILPG